MPVDFHPEKLQVPTAAFGGDSVHFRASIRNYGDKDHEGLIEVQFLVGPSDAQDSSEFTQVGEIETINDLAAGRTKTVASASHSLQEGSRKLRVVVDPSNKILEAAEGNNQQENTYAVAPASERPGAESQNLGEVDATTPVIILTLLEETDVFDDTLEVGSGLIFHNWENLNSSKGVEVTDRPTRGGGTTGEELREFPESFSFGVGVKEIPVPTVRSGFQHQDISMERQVELLRRAAEGARVRVASTKHAVTMTGIVQEVRLQDDGEWVDQATVQVTVREDPGRGQEDGIRLGELVTPTQSIDPGDDDNESGTGGETEDNPTITGAGPKLCVRRPTLANDVVNLLRGEASGTPVDTVGDEAEEPAGFLADVGDAVTQTVNAVGDAASSFYYSVGSSVEEAGRQLDPTENEVRWVSLGSVEDPDTPTTGRRQRDTRSQQRRQALRLIRASDDASGNTFGLREGRDYRFVDTGPTEILEVSGGFYARYLSDKAQAVRCQ